MGEGTEENGSPPYLLLACRNRIRVEGRQIQYFFFFFFRWADRCGHERERGQWWDGDGGEARGGGGKGEEQGTCWEEGWGGERGAKNTPFFSHPGSSSLLH